MVDGRCFLTDNNSLIPYNTSWTINPVIIEVKKRTGYGIGNAYYQNGSYIASAINTTQVPAITRPLGLYGGLNMPIRTYWYVVGNYENNEPVFTTWSNEYFSSTTRTGYNIVDTLEAYHCILVNTDGTLYTVSGQC